LTKAMNISSETSRCKRCNKIKKFHAKGLCNVCYKNYGTRLIICKQCKEKKNHMAKGYCGNCYRKRFYYDNTKASNLRRYYGDLSLERWKEITKECVSCSFNKIVDVHHIDENNKNNSKSNLIGLCPNCHKLIHMGQYRQEIISNLIRQRI